MADLEFDKAREQFMGSLESSLNDNITEELLSFVESYEDDRIIEKRAVLDQVFRDILCKLIKEAADNKNLKQVIVFAIEAVKKDKCSPSTPFMMLADVFDMLTLERSEDIFDLVEDKVSVWKSEPFYESGKNYLLRMCNDLIRRLSKSQNTVFCGRIQLFLSRLFPLSEKSALNLASQFNLENVTIYTKKESVENQSEKSHDSMEVDKADEKTNSIPIDYHLYQKFWALQDFFRHPTQCYDKAAWQVFLQHANDVLSTFSSFKLDDLSSRRKKKQPSEQASNQKAENFFAKYLTSPKLLDLQLSDSHFRRYVLVQFLILFQYLQSTVKFKVQAHTLTDEQSEWIKESQEKVSQLLGETPTNGDQFCNSVKHILGREEHWNNWKNESCPSYIKDKPKEPTKSRAKPKRRRIGDDLLAGGKITKMGSAELTRLWNLNPDNMEACKAESRVFLPKLDDFFANAIDQADPEAMVEDQYKDINQQNFQWKAYRLLARSSPHFFVHTNTPGLQLTVHLKDIVDKMAKEIHPEMNLDDVKSEMAVAEDDDDIKDNDEDEDDLPQGDEHDLASPQTALSEEKIRIISAQLGNSWMKLGEKLSMPSDDLTYFKDKFKSNTEAAANMITIWMESDPDRDSLSAIITALQEIGQGAIAELVQS